MEIYIVLPLIHHESNFFWRPIIARLLFQSEDPIPTGGQIRTVQLEIKDDEMPEPDEQLLVYLTDATGGARVATDSDSGLQVANVWVSFALFF